MGIFGFFFLDKDFILQLHSELFHFWGIGEENLLVIEGIFFIYFRVFKKVVVQKSFLIVIVRCSQNLLFAGTIFLDFVAFSELVKASFSLLRNIFISVPRQRPFFFYFFILGLLISFTQLLFNLFKCIPLFRFLFLFRPLKIYRCFSAYLLRICCGLNNSYAPRQTEFFWEILVKLAHCGNQAWFFFILSQMICIIYVV